MDLVIVEVLTRVVCESRCSVDEILESPELRDAFLANTRLSLGHLPERELLHRLTTLRKGGRLPRSRELFASVTTA